MSTIAHINTTHISKKRGRRKRRNSKEACEMGRWVQGWAEVGPWFCFPHLSCPLSILSFLPPFSLSPSPSPSPSPFPPLSPYSYYFLTLKLFFHCFHTSHHLSFLTNPCMAVSNFKILNLINILWMKYLIDLKLFTSL